MKYGWATTRAAWSLIIGLAVPSAEAQTVKQDKKVASLQNIVGLWATKIKNCRDCRLKGNKLSCEDGGNEALYVITPTRFYSIESECRIQKVDAHGSNLTLHVSCQGEGQSWKDKTNVGFVDRNSITFKYEVDGKTVVQKLLRCETKTLKH